MAEPKANAEGGSAEPEHPPIILPYQEKVFHFYGNTSVQIVVAVLIILNFMTNIVEKQIDPLRDNYKRVWMSFELGYNILFAAELAVNLYGSWLKPFWTSGWNVFDFVVVVIGLLDTANVDLGPMKMLRMMRAFRTFRLFKKVKSLNKIIVSLVHAVPGMMNAFFINALFMFIYAVLAVELFGYAESTHLKCWEENSPVIAGMDGFDKELLTNDSDSNYFLEGSDPTNRLTMRKICWGVEYYSTFGRSLYTLFQILTGDSWSEAVVRPIFQFFDNPLDQFFAGIFFMTFIMLNALVLINVVVAVLLDKMPKDEDDKEEDGEGDNDEPDPDLVTDKAEQQQIERMRKEVEDIQFLLDREMSCAEKELDTISSTVAVVLASLERANITAHSL